MSLTRIFEISSSAISAQSQRLNVVASNLANVDGVAGPDGQAYKARQVVFTQAMVPTRRRGAGLRRRGKRPARVHDPKPPGWPMPRAT
jgi:flagellar basal-body rod protein FlgC